jgi:hypothetical protein
MVLQSSSRSFWVPVKPNWYSSFSNCFIATGTVGLKAADRNIEPLCWIDHNMTRFVELGLTCWWTLSHCSDSRCCSSEDMDDRSIFPSPKHCWPGVRRWILFEWITLGNSHASPTYVDETRLCSFGMGLLGVGRFFRLPVSIEHVTDVSNRFNTISAIPLNQLSHCLRMRSLFVWVSWMKLHPSEREGGSNEFGESSFNTATKRP